MTEQIFVYATTINGFHYLYSDARVFHDRAKTPELQHSFERVPLSRTAILLYVFSLEALVNRALAEFLAEPLRSFVMEREDRFSLEEKWNLLPRFVVDAVEKFYSQKLGLRNCIDLAANNENPKVDPAHEPGCQPRA